MNKIDQKFAQLKAGKSTALMPFIMAGDPNLEITYDLLRAAEDNGADMIELGIPFSDPIADGPTIQRSGQRSLSGGTNIDKVFSLVEKIRRQSRIPISLMTYYNLLFHRQDEIFVRQAAESGADGLIIPDIPPEEAGRLQEAARQYKMNLIYFLAPTSTPERIQLVSRLAQGFIYYVSLTGITGARKELSSGLSQKLREIGKITAAPIAVGFGVSTPQHAAQVAALADGVIVGSALINILESNLQQPQNICPQIGAFIKALKQEMQHAKD